jgi:hypothetical protein
VAPGWRVAWADPLPPNPFGRKIARAKSRTAGYQRGGQTKESAKRAQARRGGGTTWKVNGTH